MQKIGLVLLVAALSFSAGATYRETMSSQGRPVDLCKKYRIRNDDAAKDQSDKLQSAIERVAAQGGGRLFLPKGTYCFNGIRLESNVHLIIDKDAVIKPFLHDVKSGKVFNLSAAQGDPGFIENVSIRCRQPGEYFTVDYSHVPPAGVAGKRSARAVLLRQVRNFLIEGMFVKDNWTLHCAATFVPVQASDCDTMEVYKPTAGLIRNFKSTNSHPGYGLVQMHAASDIRFENLSTTEGGITFRLETGAGGLFGGVDQITAENVSCINGRAALAMWPHTALNGMVTVKNIRTESCVSAVLMAAGFVDKKKVNTGNVGRFADGCLIENVHVIYGKNAPYMAKSASGMSENVLRSLWFDEKSQLMRGPSSKAVNDGTGTSWMPIVKNVTLNGFPEGTPSITVGEKKKRTNYRTVLKNYPVWDELPEKMK